MSRDTVKCHIIAPLPAVSRRTRLSKLMDFLVRERPGPVFHAGWSREPGDFRDPVELGVRKVRLLGGGGYGTRQVRFLYVAWMFRVFLYCLAIGRKDTVWALGFESAFPAAIAKRLRGFHLIFDDADRFSMLFRWPSLVKRAIIALERWTSRSADTHVIPNPGRYEFESPRFFVLGNIPGRTAFEKAKARSLDLSRPTGADLVLNINGWLGSGRGMDVALRVMKRFDSSRVHALLIGKRDCSAAEELSKLSNVTFLGEVDNSECLAWNFHSDFVFTYYSPEQAINLNAESNKWGDAVRCGAGILVNSEVRRSRDLVACGAAASFDYCDVDGLVGFLESCLNDLSRISRYRQASLAYGAGLPFFDDRLEEIFSRTGDGR